MTRQPGAQARSARGAVVAALGRLPGRPGADGGSCAAGRARSRPVRWPPSWTGRSCGRARWPRSSAGRSRRARRRGGAGGTAGDRPRPSPAPGRPGCRARPTRPACARSRSSASTPSHTADLGDGLAASRRAAGRLDARSRSARCRAARPACPSRPLATSLPATKMPTWSHTCWTWWSRWLASSTAAPSSGQLTHQSSTSTDAGRVDRGGRLVEDDDRRALDQDVGEAQPLAHAARVGLDLVVGGTGQTDTLEQLVDALLGRVLRSMPFRRAV